jgi:hypothetical protein
MSADIIHFTPKHAAAYDRSVARTMHDLGPIFLAASNGHAMRPVPVDTDQSLEDGAGNGSK